MVRKKMWSSVVCGVGGSDTPGARYKHAVCTSYPNVYLLGGKQGNLPLKDFWIYDLATRTWRKECEDKGSRPPSLQQHSMVASHGKIFVFGGELCMSNETPLWIYEIKKRQWRKWRHPMRDEGSGHRPKNRNGAELTGPKGRRGHVAVIVGDSMIIYGGYQDLRGSSPEIWSFNILEETWQQIPLRGEQPAARHAHSAITHDNQIWVYGGMTDLTERNDFWKYDIGTRTWTQIRSRPNPGLLHSHVAVKLHSWMIVFGGERHGEVLNDLWRYHLVTGMWEKLMPSGVKPHPRSQCCAFVAPSHAAKHFRYSTGYSSIGGASSSSGSSSSGSSGYGSSKSSDVLRQQRHYMSQMRELSGKGHKRERTRKYLPHIIDSNKICHCEKCLILSDDEDRENEPSYALDNLKGKMVKNGQNLPSMPNHNNKLSKISQLSNFGKYYNYSMLNNDSTESIMDDTLSSTCDSISSRLGRSKSIQGINKNKMTDVEEVEGSSLSLSRDILSVPNLIDIHDNPASRSYEKLGKVDVAPLENINETFLEDDSSDIVNSIKGTLALNGYDNPGSTVSTDTSYSENLMSFSCTETSLSSYGNNYNSLNSYTNPTYAGCDPDKITNSFLSEDYWRRGGNLDLETTRHKEFADLLKTPPDSGIGSGIELEGRAPMMDLSISALEEFVSMDKKYSNLMEPQLLRQQIAVNTGYKVKSHTPGITADVNSKDKSELKGGNVHAASRVTFCTDLVQLNSTPIFKPREKPILCNRDNNSKLQGRHNPFLKIDLPPEPDGPDAMYVLGGKELDQMTVFKRPISIWKLDLPY